MNHVKYLLSVFSIIIFLFVTKTGLNAMDNNAGSKITIKEDGIYILEYSNIEVTVNSKYGGRIASLKVNGNELLSLNDIDRMSYGSTFWPSPQAEWNWPPPSALDSKPYEAAVKDNVLEMVSGIDGKTGYQFTKKISFSEKDSSIIIDYTMKNASNSVKKVSAWEITRMPKGGFAFFPKGKTPFGLKSFDHVPYVEEDGIVWYKSTKETLKNHQLTITDGSEGWMAYINNGNILVKKFEDILPEQQATGEAEVIIYVNPVQPFIEVEAEGPYVELKPGEESTWTMKWYPRAYKQEVIGKGDKNLVRFVRNLFNEK